jgi:hypothetical protein
MIRPGISLSHRRVGLWGGIVGIGWAVGYPILLNSQGGIDSVPRTVFAAAFIVLMAGLSLLSALAPVPGSRFPQMLLLSAGTGNLGMGVLSLLSIGLPLVIVGGLQFAAATAGGVRPLPKVLLPALTLILLLVGLVLTG